jgi:polar amino acid transport system substrate-binding protein
MHFKYSLAFRGLGRAICGSTATALFCVGLSLCSSAQAQGTTISLATGEYAPFSSSSEPGNGLISAVVSAAFETQGVTPKMAFLPWQRGYKETLAGNHVATFPYVQNQERIEAFWFSKPIYTDTIRLFAQEGTARDVQWNGKGIRVPFGYNTEHIQKFATEKQARLERPADMGNCFEMLQLGRVQAVWSSEAVAEAVTSPLRAKGLRYKPLMLPVDYQVEYFLIFPRTQADSKEWLSRFNAGLAMIQRNGTYARLTARKQP